MKPGGEWVWGKKMIYFVKDVQLDGPERCAGGNIQRALGHVSVGVQRWTWAYRCPQEPLSLDRLLCLHTADST